MSRAQGIKENRAGDNTGVKLWTSCGCLAEPELSTIHAQETPRVQPRNMCHKLLNNMKLFE